MVNIRTLPNVRARVMCQCANFHASNASHWLDSIHCKMQIHVLIKLSYQKYTVQVSSDTENA